MNKVAKDMAKVYRNTPTIDLIRNKGRKQLELLKVEKIKAMWAQREVRRLRWMIHQIDVELESRALQGSLF